MAHPRTTIDPKPAPKPVPEPDDPDQPEPEQEAVAEPLSLTRPGYPDIHGTFGTSLADRGD